ncbi:ExbD/TolR family protein [Eisenibacter elegans]|jgi:biopolymer transport protein ExbD|uniref:ExbD/TolR family protein n=1 Tax=Eisenibacter elegans TaxID=997 RepID=UPI0006883C06|nr:biopolymer transporter ExbD [Eisenibacter elegans]
MDLGSKSKLETSFGLASMTDIIFLLLIFFMLTSNFVNPTALPVELPKAAQSTTVVPKVSVTVTAKLEYYINQERIKPEQLESKLQEALATVADKKVILNIDKTVPVEYLVQVAALANQLNAKVAIATKLEGSTAGKADISVVE